MIEKVIYKLGDSAYIDKKYNKTKIIVGNTLSVDMSHVDLWKRKLDGNFKGTTPYTISLDGVIHEHYSPEYYSNFLNLNGSDKNIIPILVENEGWLAKNSDKTKLITWCGDIYNREYENVVESKWRGKSYWAPYNNNQIDSLAWLCKKLVRDFEISSHVCEHNTEIDDIDQKLGIYYKSNYNKNFLDVSPAFNFENFKDKIENDEKKLN